MTKTNKFSYLGDGVCLTEKTNRGTIQVLRTGVFHHPEYGQFEITDEILDSMVRNFKEVAPKAPTEMVVDFEHQSTKGVVAVAAGWVKDLVHQDGGLFAIVEWTEEAAEMIRSDQYRFISPQFALEGEDKETGDKIGAELLSVALTNRPFIEGMDPVILCETVAGWLFREESYYEAEAIIRRAYYAQFGVPETHGMVSNFVSDIYEDYVIVEEGSKLYRLPYKREETEVVFDTANKVKVQLIKSYEEVGSSEEKTDLTGTSRDSRICLTEWNTKYINDLSDKCFAYIEPDGEKDEEGKTTPRALRHLPYKNASGDVDLPHLRNALSRLSQTKLSAEAKQKALRVLLSAAREAGMDVEEEGKKLTKEVVMANELDKGLRTVLGIGEEIDILETVRRLREDEQALKLSASGSDERIGLLQLQILDFQLRALAKAEEEVEKLVELTVVKALEDCKITPALQPWAKEYALRDPSGFNSFLEGAMTLVELGERGLQQVAADVSEQELEVARALGVPEDKLREYKAKLSK